MKRLKATSELILDENGLYNGISVCVVESLTGKYHAKYTVNERFDDGFNTSFPESIITVGRLAFDMGRVSKITENMSHRFGDDIESMLSGLLSKDSL